MVNELLSQHISPSPHAKVLVLFGGSPVRRDEVIRYLRQLVGVSIWGTLSEAEGRRLLQTAGQVDLVLIGSRYTHEQRQRIRNYVAQHRPNTFITEPGMAYPYESSAILQAVKYRLNLV